MAPHADFAVALGIRQQLLQSMIQILYNANQIEHQLQINQQGFTADLFLDVPVIGLESAYNNSFILGLSGWGPMTVDLSPSNPPETRKVIFSARLIVPHKIVFQGTQITFGFDGINATLDSLQIIEFEGGPFSPLVRFILDSPIFLSAVQDALRIKLSSMEFMPPFDVSFIGAASSNSKISARSLDGSLAMGIDTAACSEITEINFYDSYPVTAGSYFTFDSPTRGGYYIYYTVDGVGNDPKVANPTGILANKRGIQIRINSGNSSAFVAIVTGSAIQSTAGFTAYVIIAESKVVMMNMDYGPCIHAQGFGSGFRIDVIQKGTNVTTAGDANKLSDITGGVDFGMWTHPAVFVERTTTDVVENIKISFAQDGLTLNSFSLTLKEGYAHVAGKATKDSFSATFSMDAFPHLIRPEIIKDLGYDEDGQHAVLRIPEREELWFEIKNITVDIDVPWWVTFLEVLVGIFTFGIGALIAQSLISMIRDNAIRQIATSGGSMPDYTLPDDFNGTPIHPHLENFEFHTFGVFMCLTLKPQFRAPDITGPSYMTIEEIWRGETLRYKIRLPYNVHPDDPQLKLSWTVRRPDKNEILYFVDGVASSLLEISFSDMGRLVRDAPGVQLSCRVYRALGANITDFVTLYHGLSIWDTLDRTHPYVRWYHYVCTPNVQVEDDGSHTILGETIKYRTSRIHRTDYPGRCLMVSRYSISPPPHYNGPLKNYIEYLDALPFPPSEIASHRQKVCDYCFFGGPTSTVPLPLPASGFQGYIFRMFNRLKLFLGSLRKKNVRRLRDVRGKGRIRLET